MGKKKDKKIKGAEKTQKKTEKNLDKKTKKELRVKGEEDIEAIISQIEEQDRKRQQIVEEKCDPPSPRCNMTLVAHPEREILIMFGGEYFNGAKTFLYNDLFYYNIKTNEWSQIKTPNTPAPRCSHQAVILHQSGGEMWIFGGEFSSPTQSQFYHYRDLWVFNLKDQTWQKINANGGPSSRSGHRMVACGKMLFVFGGFHDNVRDFKYFNDIFAFNVETLKWMKLEISGTPPSPRSGCVMACTQDGNHVIVYGGYSKEHVKKEVEKGQIHTDMFMLSACKSKEESNPVKWKWVAVKQSGCRPSPRCSSSMVVTGQNRAFLFGGVFDEEEDEECVKGKFYNEMYTLELDKGRWHHILLRKKKDDNEPKKRRRKVKTSPEEATSLATSEAEESELSDIDEDVKKMRVCDGNLEQMETDDSKLTVKDEKIQDTVSEDKITTYDDGVFTVEVKRPSQNPENPDQEENASSSEVDTFVPSARMNPLLAVKHGHLFLYGGTCEDGDRQITFSDFYSIDINKLNEWKVIIQQDSAQMEWQESESSEDDSDSEDEGAHGGKGAKDAGKVKEKNEEQDDDDDDSDETEDDDDHDTSDDEEPAPPVEPLEGAGPYFDRTKTYWMKTAENVAKKEQIDANAKQMKKAATGMAKDFWKQQQSKPSN